MRLSPSYRNALYAALALHVVLFAMVFSKPSHQRPVLMKEAHNTPGEMTPKDAPASTPVEIVRAQSVDNREVMAAVQRLQSERAQKAQRERSKQMQLQREAEKARDARLKEEQRLAKIKIEAEQQAIARKKQLAEEQKRLQQLAKEQEQQANVIKALKAKQEALKKQQEHEAKLAEQKKKQAQEQEAKLAEQKRKQAQEQERQAQLAKEKAAREKVLQAQQQRLAEQQATELALQRARMSGEVDKYKALIVNAISRQWILPEDVEQGLASQFRIRLAPDGAVLDVALTRSSGNSILDRSAQAAIFKASPLPVPSDPATFDAFRDIHLTVRPENVRG